MADTKLFGYRQKGGMFTVVDREHYPGSIFWVDSTNTTNGSDAAGYGQNPDKPLLTIAYGGALSTGLCTANKGDVIFALPGHTEDIDAAAAIALDVAGVTIIGLGDGRNRPTITYSATAGDIDIDAANITIENFFIDVTGVDGVDAALDVNAADFTLRNCEILLADGTGQADEFIITAAAAHRMIIEDNIIRSPDAGANNAISIEGTPDGIIIRRNWIYGDFADGCIHNPTGNIATNVLIEDNILQNDQTGDHAIELVSAVTGYIKDNVLVTDAIATAADLGSCKAVRNVYFDSSDTDATGTPYPTTAGTAAEGVTTIGGIDGATTDTVHGKIGTDTEMADSSLYDLIGAQAKTDALSDILCGTSGIATFPAAAAAANAVSLAEVLRYISEKQTERIVLKSTGDLTAFGTSMSLFTVTGDVLVKVGASVDVAVTSTSGTTTLEVGITGNTAALCIQDAVDNTAFAVGDSWTLITAADANGAQLADEWLLVGNGVDIILTGSLDDITAGDIDFYCTYIPLSSDGAVAAAA